MTDFIKIDTTTIILGSISISAIGVLAALISIYVSHRLGISRDQSKTFRADYDAFRKTFTYAIQQLDNKDSSLNKLIIDEYPKHDIAMKDFIHHLHGMRKRRFIAKWIVYQVAFYKVKKLGSVGAIAAIAPSTVDIDNLNSPDEMAAEMFRWDSDRRKKLKRVILAFLAVAKKDSWF